MFFQSCSILVSLTFWGHQACLGGLGFGTPGNPNWPPNSLSHSRHASPRHGHRHAFGVFWPRGQGGQETERYPRESVAAELVPQYEWVAITNGWHEFWQLGWWPLRMGGAQVLATVMVAIAKLSRRLDIQSCAPQGPSGRVWGTGYRFCIRSTMVYRCRAANAFTTFES